MSQTMTFLSKLAENRYFLLGSHAIALTDASWPFKLAINSQPLSVNLRKLEKWKKKIVKTNAIKLCSTTKEYKCWEN